MKREQTAVEWLVERLGNDLYIKDSSMSKQAIAQAKQMEKEQIVDAFHRGNFSVSKTPSGKRYYEIKYGKDENTQI